MIIRDATEQDLPAILAIFNQVIETSTAVYRDVGVPLEERRDWMLGRQAKGFPVLVAEAGAGPVGFASFGSYRDYPGYRFTVEHSVHVDAGQRGTGVGSALLTGLIERGEAMRMRTMLGMIDADNAGSIRFHERHGFAQTGRLREVGYKFGRWLDVVVMQRDLGGGPQA